MAAFLFQFANQLIDLLGRPPLGPLPSQRLGSLIPVPAARHPSPTQVPRAGLEAGAQRASISTVVTRKVTADAAVAAARGRHACAWRPMRFLTDNAIVTSGSVPDRCYQRLVAAVERAINEADPIRLLEAGAPTDEYSPEITTILPRLAGVQGLSDVTDVLHEEFVRWFDQGIAGPREAYEEPARRIWAALLESRDVVQ